MSFEFATAGRIVFGEGSAEEAPKAAAAMGRKVLVVGRRHALPGLVGSAWRCPTGEPTIDAVRDGVRYARAEECDVVVAAGGGSVIDAGKAIAALLTNEGDPLDYLEVIGAGRPLANPSAPFIAVPTTAGTGSEVTRNAVLAAPAERVKASLRSASMLPRLALVDPLLTLDLPPALTASTGLDALTQLIEPYVSPRANAMTDLFCVDGMRRAAVALPRAFANGADREARREMSWASLLGGLALANAGLGAVHGFAAPVGGMFPAPHGAVCAALLPHAMTINIRAMRSRGMSIERYGEVARLITARPHATAEDGARWVADLVARLEIPPLRAYGVSAADVQALVPKAAKASSMMGNPVALTEEELVELITRATVG